MFLEYIKFYNYRPYYGEQVLDLRGEDRVGNVDKKIVLIGGLNGHGKTSLINGINVCFFGHRKFKNRNEYYRYLNESVNRRYIQEGGSTSFIELGFTDNSQRYAIKVNFNKTDQKEHRQIFELDEDLSPVRELSMTEEEFHDFIDKRIPVDVSQFYIFDAEKTRELVGDQDKEETTEAIEQIMSLKIYNKLKEDLDHISRQTRNELRETATETEIQNILSELDKITSKIDRLYFKIGENNRQIDLFVIKEREKQIERRKLLSQNDETKKTIANKIGQLENKLETLNGEILKSRNKLFHIILQPYINKLKQDIQKEREIAERKATYEAQFNFYENFIDKLLNTNIRPRLRNKQIKQLRNHGKNIWAKLNDISYNPSVENVSLIHDLSNHEYQTIMSSNEIKNSDIVNLVDRKQKIEQELNNLNDQLDDAPEHIDTKDLDDEIARLNQKIGRLKQENRELQTKRADLNKVKGEKEGSLKRLQSKKGKTRYLQSKNELISNTVNAIEQFIKKVTKLKSQELKYEIEVIIEQLFRKGDFGKISFSPDTFQLSITDYYGNDMDLNSRSEGEKQLMSLAMIWALTKVSGFSFPFVIDTPLARLDRSHRSNLVQHYFTKLSDQVIILSTDTEITEGFYNELKPFLRTSYILKYDNEENRTIIEEGYFFDKEDSLWLV